MGLPLSACLFTVTRQDSHGGGHLPVAALRAPPGAAGNQTSTPLNDTPSIARSGTGAPSRETTPPLTFRQGIVRNPPPR